SNLDFTDEADRSRYASARRCSSSIVVHGRRNADAHLRAAAIRAGELERATDCRGAFPHRPEAKVAGMRRRWVEPVTVVGNGEHRLVGADLQANVDAIGLS